MLDEEWVPVAGFDKYIISTHGRVANERTGKILKVFYNPYPFVSLHRDGRQHSRSVHRLMGFAFLGDVTHLHVRHKDSDIRNTALNNLEAVPPPPPRIHTQGPGRGANRKGIRCQETGEEFPSISAAARAYNIAQTSISQHLLGRMVNVGGWTFVYLDKQLEEQRRPFERISRQYRSPVEHTDTGQAYDSIKEAARALGVPDYIVHHRLRGLTRYAPTWSFKRL